MKILNVLFLILLASTYGLAYNRSVSFAHSPQAFCAKAESESQYKDASGAVCSDAC